MADWQFIQTDEEFATLIATLLTVDQYALDTEFHGERTYFPSLALVQIGWKGGIALVDPLSVDISPLAEVLRGPGVAILHAAVHDLSILERACSAIPTTIFDTQLAAGFLGLSTPSLAALCDQYMGVRLQKGDRLTDWRRRPLTAGQEAYAASDVRHLIELRAIISDKLDQQGRLQWATEECTELLQRDRSPQDPNTAWWRLKECRSLKGTSRGVAQELAAWRERQAIAVDRPPRFVLPDLAVATMAQRAPTTIAELSELRGVEAGQVKGRAGEDILAAVQRGAALAAEQVNLPPVGDTDRESRPGVALATAWIAQLSRHHAIDAALLATRSDVLAFVRGESGSRLSSGWRHDLVGAPVQQLVSGGAALAFDETTGDLVLEERSRQEIPLALPKPRSRQR